MKTGLVVCLPDFIEDLTTTTFVQSKFVQSRVESGPVPLYSLTKKVVPWCDGSRIYCHATFPDEDQAKCEQATREWKALARKIAFHPRLVASLWRKPYYHAESVIPNDGGEPFSKLPWETRFFYLNFSMVDPTTSSLKSGLIDNYQLGDRREISAVVPASPYHIQHALFCLWRHFAFVFRLLLTEAKLAEPDFIEDDFAAASQEAVYVARLYAPK